MTNIMCNDADYTKAMGMTMTITKTMTVYMRLKMMLRMMMSGSNILSGSGLAGLGLVGAL